MTDFQKNRYYLRSAGCNKRRERFDKRRDNYEKQCHGVSVRI
jgi:hypothetical protein